LTAFTIPSTVTKLEQSGLCGRKSLLDLTFKSPAQLAVAAGRAFAHCSVLPAVLFPPAIQLLGRSAASIVSLFCICLSFSRSGASLPDQTRLLRIGVAAFNHRTKLERFTTAKNPQLTRVSPQVFSGCVSLTNITGATSVLMKKTKLSSQVHFRAMFLS
jgi:hypothetical protein